jgi:N-acyl-D-aspartate/D-glutamate deacylase
MHDIVIRGGKVIDGTGQAATSGDIAIDGGTVASVGGKAGPAKRVIDADGLLVTPGWVDVHTHYDGQATWDPELAPSSWNGVTTILFGNCGVGFAPVRREHREALIELMEGVEDIPGIALAEGLKWDWESFPEYLDALDRLPRAIDVAAQLPHHPLRVYVMGDRAIRREPATPDDIAAMSRLAEEGLRAGAFGFTTSRTDLHRTSTGDLVPARNAGIDELLGIGAALTRAGRGAFGINTDFTDEAAELGWITEQAKRSGRPAYFLLTDRAKDPQRWRRIIDGVRSARQQGAGVTAQVAGRPVGVILGLLTSSSPFDCYPSFAALAGLPHAEKLARLRDPTVRAAILEEAPAPDLLAKLPPINQTVVDRWKFIFPLGANPDYEPAPEDSIAGIAHRTGQPPRAVAYDYLTAGDGMNVLFIPIANYVGGDHTQVRAMLTEDVTMLGLSDGGAHCGLISDATVPTYMLTHWARDRHRGPQLPLEWLIKRQTSETAAFFGMKDRGVLAPGMKADVNLIDFGALRLHAPEIAYDLPAGGKRLVQRADGYVATLVSGEVIAENGKMTGARPGKLVRA